MKKKSILCIIFIMALSCYAHGQEVLYPASALSLGLGNANFSSYIISPFYYNPASLTHNTDKIVTIGGGAQYFDLENTVTKYNWNRTDIYTSLSYISGKMGLSAIYRQQGDRKTFFPIDNPQSYPPFPDSLKSKDLNHTYSFLLFYGKSISHTLSLGFVTRLHYNKPELIIKKLNYKGDDLLFSVDVALEYMLFKDNFLLLLLQNIYSARGYYSRYDYYRERDFNKLPINIQIAFNSSFNKNITAVCIIGLEPVYLYKDVKYYPRNDSFHFGLRYEVNNTIRLLGGYQYRRTVKSFNELPASSSKANGLYAVIWDYVYHSLHGYTIGTDIQVKKVNVVVSIMTNDRKNYYEDHDINVTGSTLYYALSVGYIF